MNEETAKAILDAAHAAWSDGDLERMLSWYDEDLVYLANLGGPEGGPLRLEGKAALRAFLIPIIEVAESMSVTDSFQFADGVGRAQISCFLRHRTTGHVLSGTYRQRIIFKQDRVVQLEEFHDAAKVGAFWRLVNSEVDAPQPTR